MASLILSRVFKQSSRRNIREFAHAAPEFVQSPVERTSEPQRVKLDRLVNQYHDNRGRELKADVIPPTSAKRLGIDTDICPVYLVVHTARNGSQIKVCLSSGFKLQVHENQDSLVLTCAHTLEEIHLSDILNSATTVANTFVIKNDGTGYGVSGIPSSMPRHDLLLVRPEGLSPLHGDSTFPVSLYPAQIGTKVAAHFLTDYKPGLEEEGWMPCFNRLMLRKWVHGEVVGYRDFAGSGAKPGTYDSLAHMFFSAIPTPGSSGGPIIDLESGSVIGVIRGSRLDNRVAGLRGWATPSESIYEMFRLPGIRSRS